MCNEPSRSVGPGARSDRMHTGMREELIPVLVPGVGGKMRGEMREQKSWEGGKGAGTSFPRVGSSCIVTPGKQGEGKSGQGPTDDRESD